MEDDIHNNATAPFEFDVPNRVDSVLDSVFPSMSSALSSSSSLAFGSDEVPSSASSSGDFSNASSSSGEFLTDSVVPRLLVPAPSNPGVPPHRTKCVGWNNKGVTWGYKSIIGRRKEMEDAVAVVPGFMSRTCHHVGGCTALGSRSSSEISPVHFFGVYDGHGGSQVAKFCAEKMHIVLAEEWDQETNDGCEWKQRWEAAFSSGFERVDNEVLTEAGAPEIVGSTAVVVLLSGCQIITSNCGDSRAVLCRETDTVPLTVDQKPDREDEFLRIEGQGGKVINWDGARVLGVLAISRAIGDRYLSPWIIPVPEITFTTRSDEDECLIVASDGLWDVMSNDEVGEVARRILKRRRRSVLEDKIPAAQTVADNLTGIAFGRNSSDDISVIVVDLKSKKKRQPTQ